MNDRVAHTGRGTVVVTSVASDSHTWNLVYLQLLIEELGYDVVNLGPCVSHDLLVAECRRVAPRLIVVSSVNGHGYADGLRAIRAIRASGDLAATPAVIGGKLGVAGTLSAGLTRNLHAAGFDAVFDDSHGVVAFMAFVKALPSGTAAPVAAGSTR